MLRTSLIVLALALTGCGAKECVLTDPNSCGADLVCETVTGREKPLCFPPVLLGGQVFDLSNAAAIAGAEVVATDENGAPAGASTVSGMDGSYRLRIPSTRTDEKGTYTARKVMLRSQAKNYVPFPSGSRVSLPIDTAGATRNSETEPYLLKNQLTDIGLSPVPTAAQNLATVSGTVEVTTDQKSVLVLMDFLTGPGRTALADASGKFTFFNVPPGPVKLSAYSRGVNYTPLDATVATADITDLAFKKNSTGTASLSGSVQLVAGANNDGTSVVLVLQSTFIESLGRGEVPPGLRAPEGGTPPNVTGNWTISGIPDGRYVVLAAFENDGNVRDPDPGISGTQIQRIEVAGGAVVGSVSPAFKVTGAVGLVSPGRDGVDSTSATPTFTWQTYSNADGYQLKVFDALGNTIWTNDIGDKAIVTATYAGPALTAGQFYQWRVTAIRRQAPTSQTEELRGIFRVQN